MHHWKNGEETHSNTPSVADFVVYVRMRFAGELDLIPTRSANFSVFSENQPRFGPPPAVRVRMKLTANLLRTGQDRGGLEVRFGLRFETRYHRKTAV
ncbi:hypothetical protein AVEN_66932-1 [Araneus ventricosus]|uniref:Uncharacterized protein n=1 Tax=Araneus ventricosus TaxID=182803 RepID=A0A4Y2FWZ7_ARAVE|nr:hypothetical protein AVEN_66932-1 [Araneus ventricosus]